MPTDLSPPIPRWLIPPRAEEVAEVRSRINTLFRRQRLVRSIAHKAIDSSFSGTYARAWILYTVLSDENRAKIDEACGRTIVLFPAML